MALSFSNLATQKQFSFKFVFVILVPFFLLVKTEKASNSQKKISFNITRFTYDQSDVIYQGSSLITDDHGVLWLPGLYDTCFVPNVGRVLYKYLVPIWDSSTGNVASFETSFKYEATAITRGPGDGLIFFLTDQANAARIPDNSRDGLLGVADAKNAFNRFVGVEFDNYANPWDPNYEHIGINLNSFYSVKIMKWKWFLESSTILTANIIYDSPSSTLTVVVTDYDGQISTLSQMLDLKWLLPEMVVIGISGSSGSCQLNEIYSWSFTSVLNTATRTCSDDIINITANSSCLNYKKISIF